MMIALGKETYYDLFAEEAVCDWAGGRLPVAFLRSGMFTSSHHHEKANLILREMGVFCVWLTAVFSIDLHMDEESQDWKKNVEIL